MYADYVNKAGCFKTAKKIRMDELVNARFAGHGITVVDMEWVGVGWFEGRQEWRRFLFDGQSSLWVYADQYEDVDHLVMACLSTTNICPYLPANSGQEVDRVVLRPAWTVDPLRILRAIEQEFDTEIYSSLEPRYWGCESEEEMKKSWVYDEDDIVF